jgi:hypothetical protein
MGIKRRNQNATLSARGWSEGDCTNSDGLIGLGAKPRKVISSGNEKNLLW